MRMRVATEGFHRAREGPCSALIDASGIQLQSGVLEVSLYTRSAVPRVAHWIWNAMCAR